ncbi:RNA polymerase sigma factor [Chrysiogenes arsenatis]|uniref:RNA polymerase sigma factor n=1 Tax=Chrysiogenes arsenatis TaxID=309797 RepID=UPI00040F8CC3|nr:RNA polymerase sigma factor [Chrysiogenes arsenatis]
MQSTFAEFYHRYQRELYYYLLKVTGCVDDAAELMQESFARYFEHYHHEQPSRSLLYTVARNASIDRFRQHHEHVAFDPECHAQSSESLETEACQREQFKNVLCAMQHLPLDEREVLALATIEDLSYREIASILGWSEGNVKVRVHRARQALRQVLSHSRKQARVSTGGHHEE